MEYRGDACTDEDRDFIVDDGYRYDEDPTYVPDEEELLKINMLLQVKN